MVREQASDQGDLIVERKAPPRKRRTRGEDFQGTAGLKAWRKRQLFKQGGVCAICRTRSPGSALGWHVDHDHSMDPRLTPAADVASLRGVLCYTCNVRLLPIFEADPVRYGPIMPAVADYVQFWKWECALVRDLGPLARECA